MILAGANANVEAVEALLLLSQWVSHRPQADVAIGRGEEDRVAWMYIGTALRLGYFLGLDRTSFKSESNDDPATFNRKRIAWTACYICDRQVSVRVGKGFWARGPGPLSGLRSSDFPTLQPTSSTGDNYALIFQANLELTQIFSNVHDILYSTKGHGWKEMLEGRYAKYLDDFRSSIRIWHENWGNLNCSSHLKATLLLTYDYLRLYVNAFAYQATISRALTMAQLNAPSGKRPTIPQINAAAPDARFIYESLDAAKSLLSTFNNHESTDVLRYMPSAYYLFIIYSAVFLYKASSTTTMTDEERIDVRKMINITIDRLQKDSKGKSHMGNRYARLLQLLWRKAPKRTVPKSTAKSTRGEIQTSLAQKLQQQKQQEQHQQKVAPLNLTQSFMQSSDQSGSSATTMSPITPDYSNLPNPLGGFNGQGTFSWLDLDSTWNFATQNNANYGRGGGSAASNSGASAELEDWSFVGGNGGIGEMGRDGSAGRGETRSEVGIFDVGMLGEYGLLGGGQDSFVF